MKRGIKKSALGLFRGIFHLLPKKVMRPLLRRTLQLDYAPADEMTFKIADTQTELEEAFELLHDSYVKVGFMKAHPSGLRVTIYHALPTTTILVAKKGKKV